ncbi:MAG: DNA replication and repair protein RecF [Chromatiales bacterium]|nr:DNA replication and repair protein RecF [Chromatiales bacterium]
MIESVYLNCFRNFRDECLEGLVEGINIVSGGNASGKSSLAEALFFASRGRSFRTHRNSEVITRGEKEAIVNVGIAVPDLYGESTRLNIGVGIPSRGRVRARSSREEGDVPISSIAEILPLQLVAPNSHVLLEGSPEYRRQFVDWGVFHVEHDYVNSWRSFNRILKQRNAALKLGNSSAAFAWDESFVNYGEKINEFRRRYLEGIRPWLEEAFESLLDAALTIEISINQGWQKEMALKDQLIRSREQDLRLGFTYYGPQRFDLRFLVGGIDWSTALSRGEQKLLICAANIAQLKHLKDSKGSWGILVVDDFTAELDGTRQKRFVRYLMGSGVQSLLTDLDGKGLIESVGNRGESPIMFHVEHGRFTRT